MKLHYDSDTDSLYIDSARAQALMPSRLPHGLVVDFDAEGKVVGIDIEHALRLLDLKTAETEGLPLKATGG